MKQITEKHCPGMVSKIASVVIHFIYAPLSSGLAYNHTISCINGPFMSHYILGIFIKIMKNPFSNIFISFLHILSVVYDVIISQI